MRPKLLLVVGIVLTALLGWYTYAHAQVDDCGAGAQKEHGTTIQAGANTEWPGFWVWQPTKPGCLMELQVKVTSGTLTFAGAEFPANGGLTGCHFSAGFTQLNCTSTVATSIKVTFFSHGAGTSTVRTQEISSDYDRPVTFIEALLKYISLPVVLWN